MKFLLVVASVLLINLTGCETASNRTTSLKKEFCTQGTLDSMSEHNAAVYKQAIDYAANQNLKYFYTDNSMNIKNESSFVSLNINIFGNNSTTVRETPSNISICSTVYFMHK